MNQEQIINKQVVIDGTELSENAKIINKNNPTNTRILKTGVLLGLVAMSISNSSDRIVVSAKENYFENQLHAKSNENKNIYQYNGEEFVTMMTPKVSENEFNNFQKTVNERFDKIDETLERIEKNMVPKKEIWKYLGKGLWGFCFKFAIIIGGIAGFAWTLISILDYFGIISKAI